MFLRIQCEERISVEQLSDVGYWFDRRMCERAVVASRGRRFVSNKEKINRLTSLSLFLSFFPHSLPLSSPPFPRLSSTISARCPKATDGSGYVRHVNFRFLSLSPCSRRRSTCRVVPRCTLLNFSCTLFPPPLSLQNLELDRHHGETRP